MINYRFGSASIKLIHILLAASLLLAIAGCKKEELSITLEQQLPLIEQLSFSISGKVKGTSNKMPGAVFYLVEDGRGALASGKLNLVGKQFSEEIILTSPSQKFGQLLFYYNPEPSEEFDIESPTLQKIGEAELRFSLSLVQKNELQSEAILDQAFWDAASTWSVANRTLQTDSISPQVLYHAASIQDGLLYIEKSKLILAMHTPEGTIKEELLTFHTALQLSFWQNGESLLLGTRDSTVNGDWNGRWYGIQLPSTLRRTVSDLAVSEWSELRPAELWGSHPLVSELEILHFGGDDVLTMTYVDMPQLFVVTVPNGTGFSEYVYRPGSVRMQYVNTTFDDRLDPNPGEQYRLRKPLQEAAPLAFDKQMTFPFKHEGELHTFEDERGTLIYYYNGQWDLVWRYVDYEALDFKFMYDTNGESYPLGKFKDPRGITIISFPNFAFHSILSDFTPLWEDGWKMLNTNAFFRLLPHQLETLQYPPDSIASHEVLKPEYRIYTLPEAHALDEVSSALYQLEHDGEQLLLSIYDAIYSNLSDHELAEQTLNSLWIRDTRKLHFQSVQSGELSSNKLLKAMDQPIELPLPVSLFDWQIIKEQAHKENEDSPAMHLLREAIAERFLSGSGDFTTEVLYREWENKAFSLVSQSLYTLVEEELTLVAELPIQTSATYMYEKGGIQFTAQDFIYMNKAWFIADTFGHRVIKLNDQLQLVTELSTPYPSRVRLTEKGQVEIKSLQGNLYADQNLRLLQTSPMETESISTDGVKPFSLPSELIYIDSERNTTWAYSSQLRSLVLHDSDKQTVKTMYVGSPFNNAARVKIIPYQHRIIVLFDNRALLFNSDGQWEDTIEFPRNQLYDGIVNGEGSVSFDEVNGIIYLIQGYRLLKIDIAHRQTDILFEQFNANLGNVILDQHKLIFSLQSGLWYDDNATQNQLIIYNLQSQEIQRWKTEQGLITSFLEPERNSMIMRKQSSTGPLSWEWLEVSLEAFR